MNKKTRKPYIPARMEILPLNVEDVIVTSGEKKTEVVHRGAETQWHTFSMNSTDLAGKSDWVDLKDVPLE